MNPLRIRRLTLPWIFFEREEEEEEEKKKEEEEEEEERTIPYGHSRGFMLCVHTCI
jgi:hypothetical protein